MPPVFRDGHGKEPAVSTSMTLAELLMTDPLVATNASVGAARGWFMRLAVGSGRGTPAPRELQVDGDGRWTIHFRPRNFPEVSVIYADAVWRDGKLADFSVDGEMLSTRVRLLNGDGYVVVLEDLQGGSDPRRFRAITICNGGFLGTTRRGKSYQRSTVTIRSEDSVLLELEMYATGGPKAWSGALTLRGPDWSVDEAVSASVVLDGEWLTDRKERAIRAASNLQEFRVVRDLAMAVMSDADPADTDTVIVLACSLVKAGTSPADAVQAIAGEIRANIGLPARTVEQQSDSPDGPINGQI